MEERCEGSRRIRSRSVIVRRLRWARGGMIRLILECLEQFFKFIVL
jgi:hypothetical protein